jgi:Kae1-associated kinase Bud32
VIEKKILYQGAEAKIQLTKYMGFDVVKKRRLKKSYRIKHIDNHLISYRTKEEAKLIIEARQNGVSVPIIYDVDLKNGIITMEYLKGKRIKDILNDLTEKQRKKICEKIGINIARFHNNDIIHGDITTSNMILVDDKINFIDFGLGEKNSELEAKGVDLHVLMEAIESTHSKHSDCFNYVLDGYKKELKDDANQVIKKIEDIVKRGRYR